MASGMACSVSELLDSPVMSVRKNLFTVTEGIPSHYLRNFYRDAYEAIRRHMPSRKVIVFSDSGHPGAWKRFMAGDRYQNVVMDLHLYHFRDETAQDITTPRGLAAALGRNKDLIRRATDLGFPVFVGEWSGAAVLAGSSLTPEGRRAYEARVRLQSARDIRRCGRMVLPNLEDGAPHCGHGMPVWPWRRSSVR